MGKLGWQTDKQYVFQVYSLFFIILAVWKSFPILIPGPGQSVLGAPFSLTSTIVFCIGCVFACYGVSKRHHLLGHKLGSCLILFTIADLISGIVLGSNVQPLAIFTLCIFALLLVSFTILLSQSFSHVEQNVSQQPQFKRRSIQPTLS